MSYVMAGVAVAGLVAGAVGTVKKGQDSRKQQRSLESAADIPGLNVGSITNEAFGIENQFMPQATEMANRYAQANQARLMGQEEMALPGVGAARQKDLGAINKLFDEGPDWLKGVQRRGAALGIGRGGTGFAGSQAGQIGTLRLSDQEQMQRTQLGTGLLSGLLGTLRLAQTPGLETFLPTTNTLLDIRSRERAQRQQMLGAAAGIPGMGAAVGGFLQQTGGSALTAGAVTAGNRLNQNDGSYQGYKSFGGVGGEASAGSGFNSSFFNQEF
jgi:hypothetical protein